MSREMVRATQQGTAETRMATTTTRPVGNSESGDERFFDSSHHLRWQNQSRIPPTDYRCWNCGNQVGTRDGFCVHGEDKPYVALCPRCGRPAYFDHRTADPIPSSAPGRPLKGAPGEVGTLYDEARRALGAGAYTAVVMLCRKMLMNIAVAEGAKAGESFASYVDFLQAGGYFSPKARDYVDFIKKLGNEANHEIAPKLNRDASLSLRFVSGLIQHNYEHPSALPNAETET